MTSGGECETYRVLVSYASRIRFDAGHHGLRWEQLWYRHHLDKGLGFGQHQLGDGQRDSGGYGDSCWRFFTQGSDLDGFLRRVAMRNRFSNSDRERGRVDLHGSQRPTLERLDGYDQGYFGG